MSRITSTVPQFCEDHQISKSFYYVLEKQGRAPRTIKLGRRVLITAEAAAAWRVRMEEESSAQQSVEE